MNTTIHVASVSEVVKSGETLFGSVVEFILVILLEFVIGHGTAFVDVESLVFFHAVIVAIFDVFAFADGTEDISAVAPLAESYDEVASFDVFECKSIGRFFFELDNDLLVVVEIYLVHSQSGIQEWLKRLSWELDAAVKLDIFTWWLLTVRFVFSAVCLWLRNSLASGFQILISFMLILAIEPKTDVLNLDLKASCIQVIENSLLNVFETGRRANLRPPFFEKEVFIIAAFQKNLRTYEFDRNLFEIPLNLGVVVFTDVKSFDYISTVPLEEELPELFVDNVEIVVLFKISVDVGINIFFFLAFYRVSSKQIISLLVFFNDVRIIGDWTWVHLGEMVFFVFQLMLAYSAIELFVEQELQVLLNPLQTDDISCCTRFFIRVHIILLFQKSILFVFLVELLKVFGRLQS